MPLEAEETEVELALAAGDCVALVAVAWGPFRIRDVTAGPDAPAARTDRAELATREVEGLVAQGQACSDAEATWTAQVRARAVAPGRPAEFAGGELRVLRAPQTRVGRSLDRGWAGSGADATATATFDHHVL